MPSRYDDDIWAAVPEDRGPPPEHLVRFVRELRSTGDALDLGCGDGLLATHLRTESLTAADVSRVALERARSRLGETATLVELEPDAPLPFDDASFDLVLCAETLEHVRDVQTLLSEIRRVLRPGGMLAISTPSHGRLTAARAAVLGWERAADPLSPHLRAFTRRSLRQVIAEMGFDVRSLTRERRTLLLRATR